MTRKGKAAILHHGANWSCFGANLAGGACLRGISDIGDTVVDSAGQDELNDGIGRTIRRSYFPSI